ncbi:MAG: peptidoglycan-associated lipoprotein Pal [Alphaproteobacteria bacterium]|nr:peptidoglycan-associated lipoprotein Pal [Alphaproteobacteria bacterium]
MGKRVLSLLAVSSLLLVAACSHPNSDIGAVSTNGTMPASTVTATAAPVTQQAAPAGPTPGTEQDLVVNVGDRVFFATNKYDLSPEGRATIEKQAQWLKQYPSINVTIEGHCDERGTREYNLALGEKRAISVRNYLVALGIDASRLQTISYGKERPAVMGSNPAAWAQNRRGVLVVQ